MAKPAGPSCNLRCEYCFYREKGVFFPENGTMRMSDEVLEAYTREYIESQPGISVVFEWQGGEPSLAGMEFFRRALDFQRKYGAGKRITNSFQTNGTMLDQAWCDFLAKENFLVGLSLDGPKAVHNACRVDVNGEPSFDRVLHSLRLMQDYGVEVNILASVGREGSKHPIEVYRFFKEQGVRFIQFIPIVEREADAEAGELGLRLSVPPSLTSEAQSTSVTPWSVEPEPYGEFLNQVFDEWIKNDVGKIFVMNFEWSVGTWAGVGPGVCRLSPRCGRNLILEYNGDVFSCDHYMYPAYRLGNILDGGLAGMVESKSQRDFGASKKTALPAYCRGCEYLFACRGGCPKQRFVKSPHGEPGLNYLCPGFKRFHRHVDPYMRRMVGLIRQGIPVSKIMTATDGSRGS